MPRQVIGHKLDKYTLFKSFLYQNKEFEDEFRKGELKEHAQWCEFIDYIERMAGMAKSKIKQDQERTCQHKFKVLGVCGRPVSETSSSGDYCIRHLGDEKVEEIKSEQVYSEKFETLINKNLDELVELDVCYPRMHSTDVSLDIFRIGKDREVFIVGFLLMEENVMGVDPNAFCTMLGEASVN